ncbi:MAG: serine/threonine protein kinase, partial [Myxococcales bacterium]|nr:serine/threonine protein kinase [Myxococcales bacterium]
DVGTDAGMAYLAMELLHGCSLREHLAANPKGLGLSEVLDLALPLVEALVAAHAVQAVHRDLKPENIFLEQVGPTARVVVLDFGLAFIHRDDQLGRMTQHGMILGTPDYLSPEQARGDDSVGTAADIYSLGCVLYELLTGSAPFTGSAFEVLTKHVYVSPEPPQGSDNLPRELIELVMAMLRKRAEERPPIAEVLEQLLLLAGTLSGRRNRGRGEALLRNRAERMLSFSPTAPLPELPIPRASGSVDLRVAVDGPLEEEVQLGLLSNDMAVLPWSGALVVDGEAIDLIFVTEAAPARVAALVATGLPVVAAVAGDDRRNLGELARAGASEITSTPVAIDNLVRALRRAHKRASRARLRRQPPS